MIEQAAPYLAPLQPEVHVTRRHVQVGHAWFERSIRRMPAPEHLEILPSQLRPLQALMTCVRMRWMAVVSGGASSGKSSLVRLASRLAGRALTEVALSAATDTTELLGCFEQSEPSRLLHAALRAVGEMSADASLSLLTIGQRHREADEAFARRRTEAVQLATEVQRADDALGEIRDGTDGTDGGAESAEAWAARASRVEAALQTLERAHKALLIPGQSAALEVRWAAQVAPTRRLLAEMGELVSGGVRGRFVWVDGPLVDAMTRGEWVVLHNANLCNPSVLDRLNPLLERGGVLQLTECGLQRGGAIREVAADDEFRLFLTVDVTRGELSRAMRNRGVEVCVTPPPAASRDAITMLRPVAIAAAVAARHGEGGSDADDGDLDGDTADAVAGAALPAAMAAAHGELIGARGPSALHPLLQWSAAAAQRLQRGSSLADALREACGGAYGAVVPAARAAQIPTILERCVGASADEATLAARALSIGDDDGGGVRAVDALWPAPASAVGLFSDSVAATVRSHAALTVSLAALVARGDVDGDAAPLIPAADLEEQLVAAAFLFAEKASVDDHTLRRALLLRVVASHGDGGGASAPPQLRALTHAAELIPQFAAHALHRTAREKLRGAAGYRMLEILCDGAPIDLLRHNRDLFERVRRTASPKARALAPPSRDGAVQTDADGTVCGPTAVWAEVAEWAVASLEVGSQPERHPTDEDAKDWRSYVYLLPRLRILRDEMYAAIDEKARLEATLAALPPNELPTLHRSYARAAAADGGGTHPPIEPAADVQDEPLTAKQFGGRVESRLYPMFESIRQALLRILELSAQPAVFGPATYGMYVIENSITEDVRLLENVRRASAARRALWELCEASGGGAIEPQPFIVLFRALHKRLRALPSPWRGSPADGPAMNVADGTVDGHLGEGAPHSLMNGPKGNIVSQHFEAVGLAARYSEFRFNAILWKRGGHPPVARTMELARAAAELREIGGALELTHEAAPEMLIGSTLQLPAAHPAPWADAPLRRALLSGACMLQWGAHAAGSDERAAAERLLQVPAALRERLDAVGAQAEAAAAAAEQIPLAARGRVPLWPIADVRSAAAEGALLLPLGALALDAALDANTDEISTGAGGSPPLRRVFDGAVRERENLRLGTVDADAGGGPAWSSTVRQQQRDLIRRKAEDVVTTIVDGGRCPLDGGAAQLLSWRLEGAGGAAAADDASWLGALAVEGSAGWHRHLWRATFLRPTGAATVASGPVSCS